MYSCLLYDYLKSEDIIDKLFEYLSIKDLFQLECCSKWIRHHWIKDHFDRLDKRLNLMGGNSIAFTVKERLRRFSMANQTVLRSILVAAGTTTSSTNNNNDITRFDGDSNYCSGCCTYEDYDPNNLNLMEFFLWIGGSSSSSCTEERKKPESFSYHKECNNNKIIEDEKTINFAKDCYWKGFVRNTCSSLLLSLLSLKDDKHPLQKALIEKSSNFAALFRLLTKISNRGEILDKKTTSGLNDIIQTITASTSIYVVALSHFISFNEEQYQYPFLIMAATPKSGHLKIHWDDSSYNCRTKEWLIATANTINNNTETDEENMNNFACLHLWFHVFKDKPASIFSIKVDKCAQKTSLVLTHS